MELATNLIQEANSLSLHGLDDIYAKMVLVSLFLSTTALFCNFCFILDSEVCVQSQHLLPAGLLLDLCVRSEAAAQRGARGAKTHRRGRGRRRSPPGQGSGLEQPREESKHFGQRNCKAAATAAPRRTQAAAAGGDGGAGWGAPSSKGGFSASTTPVPQFTPRPGTAGASQLPPELDVQAPGKSLDFCFCNLGSQFDFFDCKKKKKTNKPKRPKNSSAAA